MAVLLSQTTEEKRLYSFDGGEDEKRLLIKKMKEDGWHLGVHGRNQAEFIRVTHFQQELNVIK